jgi:hypothetical protein
MAKRGRALEEEYFRKRELELIEKLRRRGEEAAGRRQLAERSGLADEDILKDLQALGYTPETVMLLHLVPLVQMAWAEGSVSESERALIVEAARSRGVAEGSEADRQLGKWLTVRPSDEIFATTLRAIGAILQASPDGQRDASQRDILAYCTAIASASGGILGFGKVSEPERELLARISQEIERHHAEAAKRAAGKP